VKAKCVGRPSTQGHYPDKLLDALGTLKSLQPDGERTGA
jgi:hypothetical protein